MTGAIERIDVPAEDAGELETQDTGAGGEGQERELTPREKALNEISRQANELNGIVVPDAEERDDGVQQTQQQAAETDPLRELGYYKNEAGVIVTKMKINGVEREVPASQVKAYLQKEIAGDQRLQQAAERERQLQKKEQEIAQRENLLKSTLAKPQPPAPVGVEEAERQAKEFYKNFWHGSEQDAVKAITGLLRRDTATVDTEQIAEKAAAITLSKVEQQENQKRQQVLAASVDKGNELLKRDFPEVHADPRVFSLVNAEVDRLATAQKSGDPDLKDKLPEHLIVQAATNIREFLGKPLGSKHGTPQGDSRADRKAGLKPIVRGRSVASDSRREQQIDTSAAAVVARMKGARVGAH